jgi:hypothetical protein
MGFLPLQLRWNVYSPNVMQTVCQAGSGGPESAGSVPFAPDTPAEEKQKPRPMYPKSGTFDSDCRGDALCLDFRGDPGV